MKVTGFLGRMAENFRPPEDGAHVKKRWRLPVDSAIIRNVGFVGLLQFSSYALAFITVPYLARILGVSNYGVLAFSIGVNGYLWLLVDWGFSLSATKQVARVKGDPEAIRKIFWLTLMARAGLAIGAALLLIPLSLIVAPEYRPAIIASGLLGLIGAVFHLEWLARGLERLGLFTILNIVLRAGGAILTFVLVKRPEDVVWALLLQGASGFFAGLVGYWLFQRRLNVLWQSNKLREVWAHIWSGRHYFLSQSSAIGYSAGAPIILSLTGGSHQVGLFGGAEKIIRIAMTLLAPVSVVLYARINALIVRDRPAAAKLSAQVLLFQGFIGICLALTFLMFAEHIVILILSAQFIDAVPAFRIMALAPFFAAINGAMGAQFLLPLGFKDDVSRISMGMLAFFLPFALFLGKTMGATGAAIALVTTEGVSAGLLAWTLWRRDPSYCTAALRGLLGKGASA